MRTLPLLTSTLAATLTAAALVAPATASAQGVPLTPYNDDVADAASLSEGNSYADTTIGATRESTDPDSLPGDHTVWYAYTSAIGAPIRITTTAESLNPALGAPFVVYRQTPAGLEKVAVGTSPAQGGEFSTKRFATLPTVEDDDYLIGVSNTADGADFTIDLERARKPSSVTFPDGRTTGGAGSRPQLYTPRGERPRVRVVVRTGFAGNRKPGRGEITLTNTTSDRTFEATLRRGRATFVLPKIKRSYEIVVDYPGTAGIEPTIADAYLNNNAGPQ